LIKVNCAALPSGLIESELFGHEKGAFTGASEKRVGRFELAHGGTIFLDEIGEIPSELQVKLLRVLQEHEIERVGGRDTIRVDVRVVAGTNRDLQAAVEGGAFRSDLYYRLNVFPLRVPPLRERAEDIPLLVHYFVQRYAGKIGRKITRVPKATMARLISYRWPGNVRELENVIERAVILSPGPELKIVPELLPTSDAGQNFEGAAMDRRRVERPSDADAGDMSLTGVERTHILTALKRSHWKLEGPDGAAKALKLNPSTLRSRIKKLGITRDI
jgi:transcriptional regulator with GAF, ATPase, and Fis domain